MVWEVLYYLERPRLCLILPLIISINLSEFESLFFVLFAIIYLLFRVTLLVISLTTFPSYANTLCILFCIFAPAK